MIKIFVIFSLIINIYCDTNITCPDGRICFEFVRVEEHCEILTGLECHPPCDIKNCHIVVENNVDCEHYNCMPAPPSPNIFGVKSFFIGFCGSLLSSLVALRLWRFVKKRRANRVFRLDDENLIGNEEEINGRENEGNAETRPIYTPEETRRARDDGRLSSSAPTTPNTGKKEVSFKEDVKNN